MDVGGSRVSRRSALKRIGAGTAIAWSAPILSSLRTPAYAQYPAECLPGQDSCAGPEFNCGGLARCFCTGTAEGGLICGCFDRGSCGPGGGYRACDSTFDCPAGEFCTTTGTPDCCGGICVPLCHAGCGGGAAAGAAATAGEPPAAT